MAIGRRNLPNQRLRLSWLTRAAAPRSKFGRPWQAWCASTVLRLAAGLDPILRPGPSILHGAWAPGIRLAGRPLPANTHKRYSLVNARVVPAVEIADECWRRHPDSPARFETSVWPRLSIS